MNKHRTLRLLVAAIACVSISFCAQVRALAQQTRSQTLLIAEKKNSNKKVTLVVGQKASYRTRTSKGFRKNKIVGIADSTISFENRNLGTVTIPFKELTGLKAIKPGRNVGGTAMIVAGVAGLVTGAFIEGISESNIGSGEGDPGAITLIVGGAATLVVGMVLVQPTVINLSTLETITKTEEEVAKEEALAAKLDTVQYYKKFKAGVGFGYSIGSGSSSAGTLITLEPSYRLNDDLSFGLRFESAAVTTSQITISGNPGATLLGSPGTKSLTANFQYYLSDGEFRLFLGAGGGSYHFGDPTVSALGFYPRVGFDYNHFYMTLDYNILPTQSTVLDPNPCSNPANLGNCGTPFFTETKYSYLGLKVGYNIGGGKN